MKRCPVCKVKVNNGRKTCPICYSMLDDDNKELAYQPYPKNIRKSRLSLLTKILLFISIVIVLSCGVINLYTISTGNDYYWSIIVLASVVYLWIILKYVFSNRGVITGRIIVVGIITSIGIYLIEALLVRSTDYWFSIDIVIPFILITTVLIVLIMMFVRKKLIIDTLFPLFGLTLLTAVPLLIVMNMNSRLWPAISCAALGMFSLIYMLIFHTKDVSEEFKKRLHF